MPELLCGLLIPFLGTTLGAACVFLLRSQLSRTIERALTGFAAGVMVAASVFSLILPSMEAATNMGALSFVPAAVGFWAGTLFLLLLDHVIPHLHMRAAESEGPHTKLHRTTLLALAVTLHNIPEGMAVGVVFAGWMSGNATVTLAGAMVYVVVEELIPQMSEGEHSNIGVLLFAVGFTLMMALDVALG